MEYVVALVVSILGAWVAISTLLQLRRYALGIGWYIAFTLLSLLGAALSLRLLADPGYAVGLHVRFVGFPLPVAILVFEGGQWTDFVPSAAAQHAILVADLVGCAGITIAPLTAALRLRTRKRRKTTNADARQTPPKGDITD